MMLFCLADKRLLEGYNGENDSLQETNTQGHVESEQMMSCSPNATALYRIQAAEKSTRTLEPVDA